MFEIRTVRDSDRNRDSRLGCRSSLTQRIARTVVRRFNAGCECRHKGGRMFLIRDIMYCKPGQVRPMVQKMLALSKLGKNMGLGTMRVMTDVSAERFWTVVSEIEVESIEKFAEMSRKSMEMKEFQDAMKGYHDLVDH